MTFSNLRTMMATAALGAGLLSLTTASAEEPGVVRISDGVKQIAAESGGKLPPAPLPAELTGDGIGSVKTSGGPPLPDAGATIIYEDGEYCPPGYGHKGHKGHKGRLRGGLWRKKSVPPDYGFYPPTPYPYIWRQPVVYQRYLPDKLYGTPGMRYTEAKQPMVYMPTDTTQLGFNYMYVPQWLPNRANYPMAPNPVMWQRRAAPTPYWEDPSRAKHKHRHVWKHQHDLIYHLPQQTPQQPAPEKTDEIEEEAPAPAVEASLETDAQI